MVLRLLLLSNQTGTSRELLWMETATNAEWKWRPILQSSSNKARLRSAGNTEEKISSQAPLLSTTSSPPKMYPGRASSTPFARLSRNSKQHKNSKISPNVTFLPVFDPHIWV